MMRTMGEDAYAALLIDLARKSKLSHALLGVAASSFFSALAGGTILLFYPAQTYWGFWLGCGVLSYAIAMWVHGTFAMVRIFRQAGRPVEALGAAE